MGVIGGLLQRALPLEGPYPLTSRRITDALGGRPSITGATVNEQSVLGITAVYSCVRVLSDSVASLPLLVYERVNRGKERAVDHPLYRILHEEPNPWMTPYQLKETLMAHLCLWGNAYCSIERDGAGTVVALWPLRPSDMVRIEPSLSGGLIYTYNLPRGGGLTQIAQRDILHIRGLSPDGIRGYSPIHLHRESLGLAMAAEEFGARFFGNQARPGGVLQTKSRLSPKGAANLKESWEEAHRGLTNAHRIAILEEGVEWKAIGLPPNDAQWMETRQFQLNETSRIFRVPPHKISDLNRATYSNVDKQEQMYKGDSLEPWLVRIEEQIHLSTFTAQERRRYYPEFLMDAQWRADIQTRYAAYARGKQWGWLSTNDIREMENMNPIADGDDYWQPVNMVPVGAESVAPVAEQPAADDGGGRALTGHELRGLLARAMEAAAAGDGADEDVWSTIARDAEAMMAGFA